MLFPGTTIEVLFWLWVAAFLFAEIAEIAEESSLRAYMRGSGNTNDVLIISCMLIGMAARVVAAIADDNRTCWHAMEIVFAAIAAAFIFSAMRCGPQAKPRQTHLTTADLFLVAGCCTCSRCTRNSV